MASWRINSPLAHACASACLALVVLSSLCQADPTLTEPVAALPNQSVSLADGVAASESQDLQDAPDSDGVRPPVVDGTAGFSPQGMSGGSRLLRRRDAEVTLGRTQDESMPWYRTGVGALAVVLGLVGGAFWALRRWVPSMRVSDGGIVKVVGRAAVSPKHNVALLRFGRRFILVGIAGERMSTLAEVTDADEVAELVARVGGASEFEKCLGREVSAFGAEWSEDAADAVEDSKPVDRPRRASLHASALTQLKNRLRSLQSK